MNMDKQEVLCEDQKDTKGVKESEMERVQLQVIGGLVRRENTKYKDDIPTPDPQKTWLYIYKHPLDGLTNMKATKELRLMQYIPSNKRVHSAVTRNNAWLVEELVILGHPYNEKNESGWTPLHIAASFNFWECVEVLIAVGADVNAVSDALYTPLYVAMSAGARESAALLREAGGRYELAAKPMPGYRTCLDVKLPEVPRAADQKANNLSRKPYFGQY